MAAHRVEEMRIGVPYDAIWDGNWKLGFENGVENYHTPFLHPGTAESWAPAATSYTESAGDAGSWLINPILLDELDGTIGIAGLIKRAAAALP